MPSVVNNSIIHLPVTSETLKMFLNFEGEVQTVRLALVKIDKYEVNFEALEL